MEAPLTPAFASSGGHAPGVWVRGLQQTATGTALATPLFLMHGHGIAEATIALTGGCFVLASLLRRDWRWLREGWMPWALAWWGWTVACSLWTRSAGIGPGLLQIRFFIFVAALERFALRDAVARRTMFRVIAACAVWIASQCVLQLLTGRNLFGWPRGPAGELTGPFGKPRAGPPLSRVALPVLLPPVAALLAARRPWPAILAGVLLLGLVCLMVLISQRMPLILVLFGLLVASLLLERVRPLAAVAVVAGGALLAASVAVAPASYQRLVVRFGQQVGDFRDSHYGLLYARAVEIARQHPWTGLGFDGFRHNCDQPRYFRPALGGGAAPDGGGAAICTQHPHNFYAEALDNGGLPGFALFAAVSLAWLAPLVGGLRRNPAPLRVGLFAAVLIQLWPISSTSAFSALPMGGWLFLLLGWGLAEARAAATPSPGDGGGHG